MIQDLTTRVIKLQSNRSQGDSVTLCLASSDLCGTRRRARLPSAISAASGTRFPPPATVARTWSCSSPPAARLEAARQGKGVFVCAGGEGGDCSPLDKLHHPSLGPAPGLPVVPGWSGYPRAPRGSLPQPGWNWVCPGQRIAWKN